MPAQQPSRYVPTWTRGDFGEISSAKYQWWMEALLGHRRLDRVAVAHDSAHYNPRWMIAQTGEQR